MEFLVLIRVEINKETDRTVHTSSPTVQEAIGTVQKAPRTER